VALRFSFVANWSFQVVTLAVKPVAGSLGDAAPLVRDVTAQFLPHHGRRCVLFATSPDTPDMRALTAAVGHERINCVADAMNRLLTADSLGRVPAVVRLLVKCRALVAAVHFDSCACVDAQRELDVQRHVQLHTHTHTHMECTVEYDGLRHRWVRRWAKSPIRDEQVLLHLSHGQTVPVVLMTCCLRAACRQASVITVTTNGL